jgi:hypothetical protein
MQRKWTYIAKVAIKYLYIVVDYFKSLQFIVFCVHTHAEIQTCIPFVDHLKASPLNKIAKLWTTGEYHATQFPYNLCKVQNNINKKSLTAQE